MLCCGLRSLLFPGIPRLVETFFFHEWRLEQLDRLTEATARTKTPIEKEHMKTSTVVKPLDRKLDGLRMTSTKSIFCLAVMFLALSVAVPRISAALVVQLEGDTGVTADGFGNVSAWADQSGSGYNAAQGTAGLQPLLISSAVNGHAAIKFDGSNDFMQILTPTLMDSIGGFTILVVAQHLNTSASQGILGLSAVNSASYGGAAQWVLIESDTSSLNFFRINRDSVTGASNTNGSVDTSFNIFELTYNGTDLTMTSSVMGVSGIANVQSTAANWASMSLGGQVDIGGFIHNPGSGFDFGNVNIAEIQIYNAALTSGQSTTAQGLLYDKYLAVPEPSSGVLLGIGGCALLLASRRKLTRYDSSPTLVG